MTKYYPIFLKLKDKPCIVIGGGKVAERKVLTLLSAEAKVKVISPEVTPKLKALAESQKIHWEKKPYQQGDLKGAFLVIGATNDPLIQKEIFEEAELLGIPCNIVDNPELCTFIVPSTINRGDLTIAISTGGSSPAVARRLREILEETFYEEYSLYLVLMKKIREEILKRNLGEEEKERKLQTLALAPIPQFLREGNLEILRAILKEEGMEDLMIELLNFYRNSKDI